MCVARGMKIQIQGGKGGKEAKFRIITKKNILEYFLHKPCCVSYHYDI